MILNRIASIAQGLHLSLDERDRLFRLSGHTPPIRAPYVAEDHAFLSRMFASGLRKPATLRGTGSRAAHCDEHEIGVRPNEVKRFIHPEVGVLEAELPAAAGPGPVARPARVHGRTGQRELRTAAAAAGHRDTVS